MTIKNINELEFIGESLPKINDNFSELDTRASSLEGVNSDYSGLSGFYSTHSNLPQIDFKVGNLTQDVGGVTYIKNSVYSSAGISDQTKIIFPTTIYLNIINTSPSADVSYTIKVREKSSSLLTSFVTNVKVSRAESVDQDGESRSLITFVDLGFYEWQITVTGTSAITKLSYSIKYLT